MQPRCGGCGEHLALSEVMFCEVERVTQDRMILTRGGEVIHDCLYSVESHPPQVGQHIITPELEDTP